MLQTAPFAISFSRFSRRTAVGVRNGGWGLFALLLASAGLFAAPPVLSRLELIGSGRGLALTLGADATFGITLGEKTADKSMASILSIRCSNVIYGLDEYQFTVFPRGSPLKQIIARENKENGSVELIIKALIPLDKNIRFKQKDNRWVVLLTSAPVNDFAWSAQSETRKIGGGDGAEERIMAKSAPTAAVRTGPPQATASSFLEDITILHRERVEKIVFKFDAPTEMIVKSMPEKIMVLFINAKNGLSHAAFKSEKDWLVKSIELKEVAHGGTIWLGASIFVNRDGGVKPLVQTFPDRLVIYSVRDAKQCLYLWSAKNGTTLSYNFISPQEFRVDLKKIENRALSDSKTDMGKSGTFNVKEPSPQTPQEAEAAAPLPRIIRVVIKKDNVAIRLNPSAAPASTVVGHVPFGAVATQLGKKGPWIHIKADTVSGWIASVLAIDSMKAPAALWEKIEAGRIAAVKREENLREAEKLRQEAKARQEQLATAKQKALEEQKEKQSEKPAVKPTPIEKIAAASPSQPIPDDNIKAAALSQSPSDQTAAPQKPGQKLIEYKVFGRDPFLPLKQDEEGPLPNVENLQIVGILYDHSSRIALLEDVSNKSNAYALRENDPVKNGYLLRIQPDKVLFLLNEFGISRTYAMKLIKEKQP